MLITGLFAREDIGMTANECYQHGMVRGCTIDCPVLQRGECELKDAENKELYQEYLQEKEIENL